MLQKCHPRFALTSTTVVAFQMFAAAVLVTASGCGGSSAPATGSNPFEQTSASPANSNSTQQPAPAATVPKSTGSRPAKTVQNSGSRGGSTAQPTPNPRAKPSSDVVEVTTPTPAVPTPTPKEADPLPPKGELTLLPIERPEVVSPNWSQFRGPGGAGVSYDENVPVTWGGSEKWSWRYQIPGMGSSSPVVHGDRVYVSYYRGYGVNPKMAGSSSKLERCVACLNRKTGRLMWSNRNPLKAEVTPYSGTFITQHGYASSTPVTDGEKVYASLGNSGTIAISQKGGRLWHEPSGSRKHTWGSGSSPILYRDLLIVNAGIESGSMLARFTGDGSLAWQVDGIEESWSTPILVDLPDGSTELVLSTQGRIISVDPDSGDKLWSCSGIPDYVCPSLIAAEGIVYAIGGRSPGTAMAVQAGKLSPANAANRILWRESIGSNVPSPVFYGGLLFWVNDRGVAVCLNALTGDVVAERRLDSGKVYASCVVAAGRLYVVSQRNGTFVLTADPKMEQLAHNTIQADDSLFNGSPAISEGQIFLRSNRFLYCIGERTETATGSPE